LTDDLDLDRVKVGHHAKYLGQRSFHLTIIMHTHTQHTACTERPQYLDHKVVGKKCRVLQAYRYLHF